MVTCLSIAVHTFFCVVVFVFLLRRSPEELSGIRGAGVYNETQHWCGQGVYFQVTGIENRKILSFSRFRGFRDFWALGAPVARKWKLCKAWPYVFLLFFRWCVFCVFSVVFSLRRSPEELSGIRRGGEEEPRAAGVDDCVPCLVS